MRCGHQANQQEEEFCVHNQCFSNTNLLFQTPRSQGRKYGKKKTGRSTVKAFLPLRRTTDGGAAGRNTYEKALKYGKGVVV